MRWTGPLPKLGLALIIGLAAPDARAAADGPTAFVTDLGNRVLRLVGDTQMPSAERKKQFERLTDQAFDVPQIAQFVLGRYWRTADDDQRRQFLAAFEGYMVEVYWSRFTRYSGGTFKISGERPAGGDETMVSMLIERPYRQSTVNDKQSPAQQPITVEWRIRREGGGYKIIDASVDGVSQALTYRQEFASIMAREGGVPGLIGELRRKASG